MKRTKLRNTKHKHTACLAALALVTGAFVVAVPGPAANAAENFRTKGFHADMAQQSRINGFANAGRSRTTDSDDNWKDLMNRCLMAGDGAACAKLCDDSTNCGRNHTHF